MTKGKWIRQAHRWLGVIFTAIVLINMVAFSVGEPPAWLYLSPLAPLFLMMASGIYLFIQPYLARRRAGNAA